MVEIPPLRVSWKGAVVPWVAQWTGELPTDSFIVAGEGPMSMVLYPDRRPGDWFMGVLWWRQGIGRAGEPQFAQLNTYRQRAALLRRRCQVCGRSLPKEGPLSHWLMGRGQIELVEGVALTTNPPTCEECVPVALRMCPHLMSGDVQLLRVRAYEPWGVQGEAAARVNGEIRRTHTVRMPFGHRGISTVVAKQLVVALTDFDMRPAASHTL